MTISFTRGDTHVFKFKRKNTDGSVITTLPTKMWFTVKRDRNSKTNCIQKTLTSGIVYDTTTNVYHVTIENADTRNLSYGDYIFDIQILYNNQIKTIIKGDFVLEDEVTFDYE